MSSRITITQYRPAMGNTWQSKAAENPFSNPTAAFEVNMSPPTGEHGTQTHTGQKPLSGSAERKYLSYWLPGGGLPAYAIPVYPVPGVPSSRRTQFPAYSIPGELSSWRTQFPACVVVQISACC